MSVSIPSADIAWMTNEEIASRCLHGRLHQRHARMRERRSLWLGRLTGVLALVIFTVSIAYAASQGSAAW